MEKARVTRTETKRFDPRIEEVPEGLNSPPLVIRVLAGTLVLLVSSVACVVLLW